MVHTTFNFIEPWLLTFLVSAPCTHFKIMKVSQFLIQMYSVNCGKQMEKLSHYHFSWTVFFQKLRYHVCESLETGEVYFHL
jgi:hypothetical protein